MNMINQMFECKECEHNRERIDTLTKALDVQHQHNATLTKALEVQHQHNATLRDEAIGLEFKLIAEQAEVRRLLILIAPTGYAIIKKE